MATSPVHRDVLSGTAQCRAARNSTRDWWRDDRPEAVPGEVVRRPVWARRTSMETAWPMTVN